MIFLFYYLIYIIWFIGNIYLSKLVFDDYSIPDENKKVYNLFENWTMIFANVINWTMNICLFIMIIIFILLATTDPAVLVLTPALNLFFLIILICLIGDYYLSELISDKKHVFNRFEITMAKISNVLNWFIVSLIFLFIIYYLLFMQKNIFRVIDKNNNFHK